MNSYHILQINIFWYEFVSHVEFLCQLGNCPPNPHKVPKSCIVFKSSGIAPMFEELWSEIADAPGEIFDVIEYKEEWEKEEKFDVEGYIKGNTDYWIMKNYRVRVETNDGCVTIWYEKSKAIRACDLISNRVYNQLCGLNIKEISVNPSVWLCNSKSLR